MVQIKNLKKSFGDNKVLDGIDLNIPDGKTMVIIGQSGCGKSVLLKHIIGIMEPDQGEVLINNINIHSLTTNKMDRLRLKFGMVFQSSALFDSMTVAENVGFAIMEHTDISEQEINNRVRECLKLVGLEGIEEKMPAELSGGMKKRVALARAISMNPEIILYDEPTVGIDPIRANSINKLIKKLHDKLNVTSVAVTHDINSAYYIADKIAMLHKGKIITVGTPEEIKNSEHPNVRKFVRGIITE